MKEKFSEFFSQNVRGKTKNVIPRDSRLTKGKWRIAYSEMNARVAQWQSRGLISLWSAVQICPLAPSMVWGISSAG